MTPRPAYTLTIEALPDQPGGPPAILRLRSWLKSGLRAHRLRCVRIEPAGVMSNWTGSPTEPVQPRIEPEQ